MQTAKVSTKGQIVLPQKLRERARVRPGDTFEFLDSDDPGVIGDPAASEASGRWSTETSW